MSLYKKAEQFVIDAFGDDEKDILHGKRTVYWIKKLKPDADEALLVAGIAHDIERAFNGDWKKGSNDPDALQKHQDMSASEIEKFLKLEKVDKDIIEKVKMLVAHHEEGGNEEQNMLCDADCLAFFEEKALRLSKKYRQEGLSGLMKKKIDYVFSRLTSSKAKKIAKKWYKEALMELDKK